MMVPQVAMLEAHIEIVARYGAGPDDAAGAWW